MSGTTIPTAKPIRRRRIEFNASSTAMLCDIQSKNNTSTSPYLPDESRQRERKLFPDTILPYPVSSAPCTLSDIHSLHNVQRRSKIP
jgi:hypothetical protein